MKHWMYWVADEESALQRYDELAQRLATACNIPQDKGGALRKALRRAYLSHDRIGVTKHESAALGTSRKKLRTLHRMIEGARGALASLDADQRTDIEQAVAAKNKAAFYETVKHTLCGRFVEKEVPRLALDQLLADMAHCAEQYFRQAHNPRGRPPDAALKGFVAVLRAFWVGELGRAFYDNFQEDFGEYEPVNDASRFVVEAVQALIGDVDVGTIRWMMRSVNKAT